MSPLAPRNRKPSGRIKARGETTRTTDSIAHVRETDAGYVTHSLSEHSKAVARLAAAFAGSFGAEDWALLAGRWHDLGKYQSSFQRYIGAASGYRPDAHIEQTRGSVKHAIVGAIHAIRELGDATGRVLGYLIAGHHAGLHDWNTEVSSLARQIEEGDPLYTSLTGVEIPASVLEGEQPTSRPPNESAVALWIRMIFSCLVDADFLDTELFMSPQQAALRASGMSIPGMRDAFDDFTKDLERAVRRNGETSEVNRARSGVLKACREKANLPPGLFSLTVPTGGGKTLASIAFALAHADYHNKERVIYVVPYLSIIEQTVDVFRQVVPDAVLEHHSGLDPSVETPQNRVACENWDATLVVTTAVQFFESLFASRTSRVRKLHNIVNSVVILDEAQSLPPDYLLPIMDALNHLAEHFGVTVLLMTATQPALEARPEDGFDSGLRNVREIIDDPVRLHESLRRVSVVVPEDLRAATSWVGLGDRIASEESVLCIVNTRADCRALYREVKRHDPGVIHLSALMCGEHRAATIREIQQRLTDGEPVKVVSTQLIEAGVDLDFPVVYRALTGIDSIAQAAGRCNREGTLEQGRVFVFVPPSLSPVGHLRQAEACGRQALESSLDPLSLEAFHHYFRHLYWLKGDGLDKRGIRGHLSTNADLAFRFRTAGREFRLIDDAHQSSVIVRYGSSIDPLIERIETVGPTRETMRRLQRKIVTIREFDRQRLLSVGAIREIHTGVFVQEDTTIYDEKLGLVLDPSETRSAEGMVV